MAYQFKPPFACDDTTGTASMTAHACRVRTNIADTVRQEQSLTADQRETLKRIKSLIDKAISEGLTYARVEIRQPYNVSLRDFILDQEVRHENTDFNKTLHLKHILEQRGFKLNYNSKQVLANGAAKEHSIHYINICWGILFDPFGA
jgi:hypothetical protein